MQKDTVPAPRRAPSRPSRALRLLVAPALALVALAAACGDKKSGPGPAGSGTSSAAAAASVMPPHDPIKAPERAGGALMRSADGARLYLADEDHKALRVLPLPFTNATEAAPAPSASAAPSAGPAPSGSAAKKGGYGKPAAPPPPKPSGPAMYPPIEPPASAEQVEVPVAAAPAQVLPVDGYVLATLRDPGALLVMREVPGNKLVEERRIPLAADAWGIALTPDEKVAVVTSAWTHTVSGVDWRSGKVLWSTSVAREPRGVVVLPSGSIAYVSHLTSGDLTKIDGVSGESPKVTKVSFPAAPAHAPSGITLDGSLGYAMVIDDGGHRLLAARHALGALANGAWYGSPTIDVLLPDTDKPLLAPRVPGKRVRAAPAFDEMAEGFASLPDSDWVKRQFTGPAADVAGFVQPRAMIVAHKSQTVWVASEGDDSVFQFPMMAAAPSERTLASFLVGRQYKDPKVFGSGYSDSDGIAGHCGAPTGLALSADEETLYVFCRSTYDVAAVSLGSLLQIGGVQVTHRITVARVATDPIDETGSRGRRLFYGARDSFSSGGMGCAGCHPEGRDDGHVWHEVYNEDRKTKNFLAHQNLGDKLNEGRLGYPRQTPMLAGRVNAAGPYGWHAQDEDLVHRLADGFGLHRWGGDNVDPKGWMIGERANGLVSFLRKGLVPPPRASGELTEQQKRGKEVFESDATQCTVCHVPASELTNRTAAPLPKLPTLPGFEDEADDKFKTPSLLFIGGTAPYFHDGSAATLAELVAKNGDRMGKTSQLSQADRDALVAYLETL